MLTDAQLAIRSTRLWGSEVAWFCGLLTKYGKTVEQFIRIKAGLEVEPAIPEERVYWGTVLEPIIRTRVSATQGWQIDRVNETILDPTCAYRGCTPDGVIAPCPGHDTPGILEIKNAKFCPAAGPPDYYVVQLQWNLACAQMNWGVLAILVGGCELRIFEYAYDPQLVAALHRIADTTWNNVSILKHKGASV